MHKRSSSMLFSLLAWSIALAISFSVRTAFATDASPARLHFEAGMRALEERRYADAVDELELSFALRPAYEVLFNLGGAYAVLGRPVEAVDAFERYLRQGGPDVAAERRAEVERELERQRAKLGELEISVSEPGLELQLDARVIGRSPLHRTLTVAAGTHVLQTSGPGFQPLRSEITVAPRQTGRYAPQLLPYAIVASPTEMNAQPTSSRAPSLRVVGYTLGGVGLATLATGIVVTALGQSQHLDAVDKAESGNWDDAERLEDGANRQKIAGYTMTAIGGASFLAGAVILLSAPRVSSTRSNTVRAVPWASASAAGITWKGQWQ